MPFLEKAFLLHELFSIESVKDVNRKFRLLYDLEMANTNIVTNT